MRVATLLLLLLPLAHAHAADLRIDSIHLVGRAGVDAPWTAGPTEALLADAPELAVVALGRLDGRRVLVADAVEPHAAPKPRGPVVPWPDGVSVRWATVEPHAWREPEAVAPNGVTTRYHSNVHMDRDRFGKWAGYDEVTYFESPLPDLDDLRRIPAVVRPTDPTAPSFGGLGTIRYRVEVTLPDGTTRATPGASDRDHYGIRESVHRVSVRRDDTFTGWLSSYFLVPEVFGSSGPGKNHQTDRYVGADCADVLTGALRAAGYRIEHSHVAGLTKLAAVVAGPVDLDDEGNPPTAITGVQVGDVIRIDYGGALSGHTPRSWDHVAVLWEDRSDPESPAKGAPDGHLDGYDLVVHMGHPRLVIEPLANQCPARVDVLRWSPKRLGKVRR